MFDKAFNTLLAASCLHRTEKQSVSDSGIVYQILTFSLDIGFISKSLNSKVSTFCEAMRAFSF